MSNEYGNYEHIESNWNKTQYISTDVNDNFVKVIKNDGTSKQQWFYPSDLRLSGDFEITMELQSDNGKYISFILNSELSYGGVTFGWRKLTDWTNLKIKRTNGLTKVYFGKSKTPQYTQEYDEDDLYFIFRFNGLDEEYNLRYRNFKIVSSNRVIFKDFYLKDDVELMLKNINTLKNEIETLSEESELLQKTVDSQNILLNTILVHYELVPKQIIRNLHELYKEILIFIDNICHKHNLKWWIDYGNLLGAYRHGGFIPWDDDCDIGMLRRDIEKFSIILPKELEENNLTDNILFKPFTRINDNLFLFSKMDLREENELLGFVDIFPYDFTSNEEYDRDAFVKGKLKLYRGFDGHNSKILMDEIFEENNLSYNYEKYMVMGVEGPANYFALLDTKKVLPLRTIKVEDKEFPCPRDVKSHLTNYYGDDFLKIPKTIYDHGVYNKLINDKNKVKLFEKYIKRLKEVNENFK